MNYYSRAVVRSSRVDEAANAPRTIVDRETLERELETVRARGYATALDELEPELAKAVAAEQEAGAARARLLDAFTSNSAAVLAAELRAGEPCVVCGSTEHPSPFKPSGAGREVSQAELNAALERQTAAARTTQGLTTRIAKAREELGTDAEIGPASDGIRQLVNASRHRLPT